MGLCCDCKWYEGLETDGRKEGRCCVNPPTTGSDGYGVWPIVDHLDSCGRFALGMSSQQRETLRIELVRTILLHVLNRGAIEFSELRKEAFVQEAIDNLFFAAWKQGYITKPEGGTLYMLTESGRNLLDRLTRSNGK